MSIFLDKFQLRSSVMTLLLPVFSTVVYYLLCYQISSRVFSVTIKAEAIPYDFALQLLLACALYAVSRRAWLFVVVQGLLMGVLYIGNAVKISVFGGPILPDDIYALRSLLLVLNGWELAAVAVPLAAFLILLVLNFSLRRKGAYLALIAVSLLPAAMAYSPDAILKPMDRYFGNVVWSQQLNYLARGAGIFSLQEIARYFVDTDVIPSRQETLAAARRLLDNAARGRGGDTRSSFKPRNVHVILLESFWDPSPLQEAHFNRPPLDARFLELWAATDHSQIMSPVFGGYTANAEFEALCGFPVSKDGVKFERRLTNDVPCLPRILDGLGYTTVASHPNVPVFWNRTNAYRRIGFQHYWSQNDFSLDDMNGTFLSDASLYRQVLAKLEQPIASGGPVLDYIVTYSGHLPYPLNEARPNVVTSDSKVRDVGPYANTVYYKSHELMALLDELRRRDPDAIIALFGDHLPFLGANFAAYAESGLLYTFRSNFSSTMYQTAYSTPLVVIDGRRGPLQLGAIPLYRLPRIILDLLGYDEPTIMDLAAPPEGIRVRPLPGIHFDLTEAGSIELCKEPPFSQNCGVSQRWLEDIVTLGADLFTGRQYALHKAGGSELAYRLIKLGL